MKLVIIAEATGIHLKDKLVEYMKAEGYDYVDATQGEMDYISAGALMGELISSAKYDLGVIMCGSGMGVNLVANRYEGVYCGLCESVHTAKMARTITNCNVLALGGNIVAYDLACKMLKAFVETDFLEGFDSETAANLKSMYEDMKLCDNKAHHM